jgi:hypothetical protein
LNTIDCTISHSLSQDKLAQFFGKCHKAGKESKSTGDSHLERLEE